MFRGLGDTRAPLYATLGVSAANIALCPALIFGAGWGVPGAALATVFAEVPPLPGGALAVPRSRHRVAPAASDCVSLCHSPAHAR